MRDPRPYVPEWLLERYAFGLLEAEQRAQVERDLQQEPGGPERLARYRAQLDEERSDVLSEHPVDATLDAIQSRYSRALRQSRAATRRVVFAFAAAAVLFLVWGLSRPASQPSQPKEIAIFSREASVAKIGERATVELSPETHVTGLLREDLSAALTQEGGSAKYRVAKNGKPFEVRVPSAETTISVRGTTFHVSLIQRGAVWVAVEEGHVVVESARGSVDLYAGGCAESSVEGAPREVSCKESEAKKSETSASQGASPLFEFSDKLKDATKPITEKK